MRALIINCSASHYNLGARKLTGWLGVQGYEVTYCDGDPGLFAYGYDLVCLSVIFSWHAPLARDIALRLKAHSEVWCGGPRMFALTHWWERETGLVSRRGLDQRFERQRGTYRMTFASRGCPVNCSFCLTPETLIQTAEGLKPIIDVQVGDLVLTHCGRYRPVTQVLTREFDGIVHELRNGAISKLFPTVVTPEHPVWIRHVSYPTGGAHLTDFRWVEAGNLKPAYSRYSRDVTAFPRTREEHMPGSGTIPGARTIISAGDYTYSRIGESVQHTYTGTVYNLEVEEDHSYCTPSFAVHNCIVPRIEGQNFTLDWDFVPAPILCDNNLSALPVDFQRHIIQRYRDTETSQRDANSGFEPHTFDEECYRRWKPILRGPWRFAFDEQREAGAVERMMRILAEEPPRRKQVYVLIGNEPIAACCERAQKVIAWGGEPFCQPYISLNALSRTPRVAYDWTPTLLRDFARYFNRHLWRRVSLREYTNRKGQPPPFATIGETAAVDHTLRATPV